MAHNDSHTPSADRGATRRTPRRRAWRAVSGAVATLAVALGLLMVGGGFFQPLGKSWAGVLEPMPSFSIQGKSWAAADPTPPQVG